MSDARGRNPKGGADVRSKRTILVLTANSPLQSDPTSEGARSRSLARIDVGLVWLIGHASRVWPFLVFALVLALSWRALGQVHPRDVRAALHDLDRRWLVLAGALTVANIGAMGLYDVVAFRHTRSRWTERWRYGAVCFAWSNFLTLGPLAGPAIRFWLYRPAVEQLSDLHAGIVSVAIAFSAGLAGWVIAALVATRTQIPLVALIAIAFAASAVLVGIARRIARRIDRLNAPESVLRQALTLAAIGWLDWSLAALTFVACLQATGTTEPPVALVESFFLGQALGVVSLVPGGFGSSDAFWVAHLPIAESTAAAVLVAYRLIYYVIPWVIASLLLLAWVTRRTPRRLEVARRTIAGLVGGGGVLIMLSSALPALYARLPLLERYVPLPLVEIGHVAAALAGLLLLVLARGLGRGYRAAFRVTLVLLGIAIAGALLKGLDWEEASILALLGVATWSQASLFDRPSRGDPWIEGPDLLLAVAALTVFIVFGALSHSITASAIERWTRVGYRFESARFLRTAASMALAVSAGAAYVLMRAPVTFRRLHEEVVDRALALHARIGEGSTPLMVAAADKSVFFDGDRGFCLYRTIGPYLVVFSDPVVRSAAERTAFLDALFTVAGELDRRPVFYQISLDWIPVLHDRGYDFFKLGEEAHVPLSAFTLEGHAGKMYRQALRRAERDDVRFRILEARELGERMAELREISDDWLATRQLAERQFSIGRFDEAYLRKCPCAVVEGRSAPHRLFAFANLLEGPRRSELSVDLMRYRTDGPHVMDFLFTSLFLYAREREYANFNLGMAPLASVGDQRGAHARERLARLLFQRSTQFYNFQGLRFYKEKFSPEWVPRYMAYQQAWEWPVAIAYVSALIAGGWSQILLPTRNAADTAVASVDIRYHQGASL